MRKTTPSFIHELPLRTTLYDEAELAIRLDAARHLYNACLGELLKRVKLMRESKTYQEARKMPKGKLRKEAFSGCWERFGFQEYSIHLYAAEICRSCWIGERLDSHPAQKIATRAFAAAKQYVFGKRGRPRFKRRGWIASVEGKSNTACIRWRNGRVLWNGLDMEPLLDRKDKYGIEAHALSCPVKYLRLVKRNINGKTRWFVQLVLEGQPCQKAKNVISSDTCGLDIGPSTIAVVGESDAFLSQFCDEVVKPWKEIRREQRAQDRSRRASNPDNYNEDGTIKKGSRKWHRSNRYRRRQARIAECERMLAATRKKQHGRLCNKILSIGNNIKTENLSYKSFQRNYGRSVSVRAPGMFVSQLTRKAENAGGNVELINTTTTKLSQTCICGKVEKKPLKLRHHICDCGAVAQRDLFSAFLARHCGSDTLDIRQAKEAWPSAEPLVRRAMSRLNETAIRGLAPASFGLSRSRSCSPVKDESGSIEVVDVVAIRREPQRNTPLSLEPPGFSHGEVQGCFGKCYLTAFHWMVDRI